jgi:chemotaxis methyl-accepting protein methylase
MTPADEGAYAELARKISRGSGLALQAYKDKCIRRRIAVRMRACGVHSYADYHALLDRSPGEYERLRDALTINVTRFFRNAETWSLLRRSLIPALCAPGRGELLAWSAGCSSGEEPYTLAVLVAEFLQSAGRPGELDRVTIDATDVDRACLERARAARYSLESLGEMPGELLGRYFEPAGMEYRVAGQVRTRVQIRAHDMTAEPPPRRGYHLILCRNVLIYFDRPMQERLFNAFTDALAPGGYLVLGKVETLFGAARERLTLLDPRERVYRRPE